MLSWYVLMSEISPTCPSVRHPLILILSNYNLILIHIQFSAVHISSHLIFEYILLIIPSSTISISLFTSLYPLSWQFYHSYFIYSIIILVKTVFVNYTSVPTFPRILYFPEYYSLVFIYASTGLNSFFSVLRNLSFQ